jgi:hypothetical protein
MLEAYNFSPIRSSILFLYFKQLMTSPIFAFYAKKFRFTIREAFFIEKYYRMLCFIAIIGC